MVIGIEQPNGKIQSTYGHYDGYPQHTGKLLKKIIINLRTVKQLMKRKTRYFIFRQKYKRWKRPFP